MSDSLSKHLEEIREIKRKLLPPFKKSFDGFAYEVWHRPNVSGGGDYFDLLELPGSTDVFGAMIADVSGHGAGAAIEAAMLDAILRTHTIEFEKGPANVLNYANRFLFSKEIRGRYITAFTMNYDRRKRAIAYVNAGHPPPVLCHTSGRVSLLDGAPQIPLCVDPAEVYQNERASVTDVERIVLYTDGITELRDVNGKQLGIAGFCELIEALHGAGRGPGATAHAVADHVLGWARDLDPEEVDDMTVLVADLGAAEGS